MLVGDLAASIDSIQLGMPVRLIPDEKGSTDEGFHRDSNIVNLGPQKKKDLAGGICKVPPTRQTDHSREPTRR